VIVASPLHAMTSSTRKSEHKRERQANAKKSKRTDEPRRDSLIECQPQASAKIEKEAFCQLCEMCNHYFQHPVIIS
jgi:hypothetical protein